MSGDMFLGALVDLGVDFGALGTELKKLGVAGFHLHCGEGQKYGIRGVKFDVRLEEDHDHDHDHDHGHAHGAHDHGHHHDTHAHHHSDPLERLLAPLHQHPHKHEEEHRHERQHGHAHGRNFSEIKELIQKSPYSAWVKERTVSVFARIARAEGKIHGKPPEDVHFHEVGAVDSIVDIIGGCIGLELLGKPRVRARTVVEGAGFVQCAHGRFPIPAPATLAVLAERGIALEQCDEPHELLTPTGAALLAEFAESFGPMPKMRVEKIGYGLGTRDNKTRPNVLRAIFGEEERASAASLDWEMDTVAVLETNLDDLPSEILGHVMELAFSEGALDVFHTPVQMKKNRPGVLLTILCQERQADHFAELLLRQTSAFGVRTTVANRRKLRREIFTVETKFGPVQAKAGFLNGVRIQAAPEYDSCQQIARKAGVPLKDVFLAAQRALAQD
jgi:uncharacterized protein (TIGR00299 family) protein